MAQTRDQPRIVVRRQFRNEPGPDPVAEENGAQIGTVRHVRDPFPPEKFKDLGPPDIQQRTDEAAGPDRKDPLEPFRTASPEQMDQDGFRLVVPMMSGSDLAGPHRSAASSRKRYRSSRPISSNERPFPPPQRTDIDRFTDTGDSHFGAETTDKRLFTLRFGPPQAVIQMRRRQPQPIFVRKPH